MSLSTNGSETPYGRNFRTAKSTLSDGERSLSRSLDRSVEGSFERSMSDVTPGSVSRHQSEGPFPGYGTTGSLPRNGSGDGSCSGSAPLDDLSQGRSVPLSQGRVSSERPLPQRSLNYNSDSSSTPSWRMERVRTPKSTVFNRQISSARARRQSESEPQRRKETSSAKVPGVEATAGPEQPSDNDGSWQTQVGI